MPPPMPPRQFKEDAVWRLLLEDEGMRGQLLSELSQLAEAAEGRAVSEAPLTLRLILHTLEVSARSPALGTLLVEHPRRLDDVMGEALTRWLRNEADATTRGRPSSALQDGCHHMLTAAHSFAQHSAENGGECPICPWIVQWPRAFREALRSGAVKVALRSALSALPSFLMTQPLYSPLQRPGDAAIGAGQWMEVIGHVTGIFFLHRESIEPEPMIGMQPLLANCNGVMGQSPIWIDLSFLPQSERRALAVIGERVHVVGLLEAASNDLGTMLYSKRGDLSSSVQLVLEARAARTAKFVSQWSQDPFMTATADTTSPSFLCVNGDGAFDVNGEDEVTALRQAKCSWKGVAGAAAFASAKATGGFRQQDGVCRVEAFFAASKVFLLPTALWAAVGISLTSAAVPDSAIAASVVGPTDALSVLQTFLLEFGAETGMVIPLVRGVEGALLPTYARTPASQVAFPMSVEAGSCVESVRAGLLNMVYQRVLFAPALHAVPASALHALQGVLEHHEHVVVREGGQRVSCKAVGAFIGVTQEIMLVQHRHLFQFLERGDIVVHASPSSLRPLQEQAEMLLEMVPTSGGSQDSGMTDFVKHCTSQWHVWREWARAPSVEEPFTPQLSAACSELLRTFFLTAKAICAEATDVSMMNTLVKLTSAHALLRRRAPWRYKRDGNKLTDLVACVCPATKTENGDFTALVDAVVAIALCDASLKFIAGVSLIGELSVFDLIASDDQFNIVQFAKQLHEHLTASLSEAEGCKGLGRR
ncbi:hypothetical protein DQ04_00681120 [Trypanosoma grayi]|uniref:hypothetical protein n=1 Tax=Trypanosoma grayi TaxID=71804 RepID=UPI0004F40974|nr:hypothetical protein DQ04_00681120 [Trypanosoma grayi]KEG13988.1 hypothetical protein DQ04_00681120 [Trypanosoma grayi]